MAILKRFGDIMRANINALLDKAEDPAKMVDQMLLDLNEDLASVKKETASVMAAATNARQQVNDCKADIAKYEAAAKAAVKAGNDDDARKLLATKQQYESTLTSLETAATVAEDNAAKMRQMHDKLVNDINSLQARRAAVHAKVSVANAQQHVNEATEKTAKAPVAPPRSSAWRRRPTACSMRPTPRLSSTRRQATKTSPTSTLPAAPHRWTMSWPASRPRSAWKSSRRPPATEGMRRPHKDAAYANAGTLDTGPGIPCTSVAEPLAGRLGCLVDLGAAVPHHLA